jgi:hypothetical protein
MSFSIPTLKPYMIVLGGCTYSKTLDVNTLLLLHGEDFTDYGYYTWGITNTNVTINSSSPLMSGFCNNFRFNSSNSSYLTVPSTSDVGFIRTTFTFEFWINVPSLTTAMGIASPATGSGFCLFLNSSGYFVISDNGGYGSQQNTSPLTTNTWYHVAFVSTNTGIALYIDGNAVGLSLTSQLANGIRSQILIGNGTNIGGAGAGYLNAYIDELRISDIARYTGNFTRPSVPFA